jgi:hypothetical protein
MKEQSELLYSKMLAETDTCRQQHSIEKEQIECAFRTCEMNWKQLQHMLHDHRFRNEEDEAWFFRNIKPKFTGLLEYYAMVYKAALFIPDDNPQDIHKFWQNEIHLARRFFSEHESFYHYYKTGDMDMDNIYFVRANGDPTAFPTSRVYTTDPRVTTTHDHLIASFIARERYITYVEQQLARMGTSPAER